MSNYNVANNQIPPTSAAVTATETVDLSLHPLHHHPLNTHTHTHTFVIDIIFLTIKFSFLSYAAHTHAHTHRLHCFLKDSH